MYPCGGVNGWSFQVFWRPSDKNCYAQKKVGPLPPVPLLEAIDINGKDIASDALLTQTSIGGYIVRNHGHYHFTVKKNQPGVLEDIVFFFGNRKGPHYEEYGTCEYGRIEVRKIWTTSELNDYLNFLHVDQAFVIERESTDKKSGQYSQDIAYGITSRPPEQASPKRLLAINRGDWTIENNRHYILDWSYDEDRNQILTGHCPESMTRLRRLRRLAIGIMKSKGVRSVARKMRQMAFNTRTVFDYFKMTQNSYTPAATR